MRTVLGGENFTLAEFFRRFDRITALAMLKVIHEDDFAFPAHKSTWKWDEIRRADQRAGFLPPGTTMEPVLRAIMSAKLAAIKDMSVVSVHVNKLPKIYPLDGSVLDELDADDGDASRPQQEVRVTVQNDEVANIADGLVRL